MEGDNVDRRRTLFQKEDPKNIRNYRDCASKLIPGMIAFLFLFCISLVASFSTQDKPLPRKTIMVIGIMFGIFILIWTVCMVRLHAHSYDRPGTDNCKFGRFKTIVHACFDTIFFRSTTKPKGVGGGGGDAYDRNSGSILSSHGSSQHSVEPGMEARRVHHVGNLEAAQNGHHDNHPNEPQRFAPNEEGLPHLGRQPAERAPPVPDAGQSHYGDRQPERRAPPPAPQPAPYAGLSNHGYQQPSAAPLAAYILPQPSRDRPPMIQVTPAPLNPHAPAERQPVTQAHGQQHRQQPQKKPLNRRPLHQNSPPRNQGCRFSDILGSEGYPINPISNDTRVHLAMVFDSNDSVRRFWEQVQARLSLGKAGLFLGGVGNTDDNQTIPLEPLMSTSTVYAAPEKMHPSATGVGEAISADIELQAIKKSPNPKHHGYHDDVDTDSGVGDVDSTNPNSPASQTYSTPHYHAKKNAKTKRQRVSKRVGLGACRNPPRDDRPRRREHEVDPSFVQHRSSSRNHSHSPRTRRRWTPDAPIMISSDSDSAYKF